MAHDLTNEIMIEGFDPNLMIESEMDLIEKDWQKVFASRQNGTVLQAEVIGIEEKIYAADMEKAKPCLVVTIGELGIVRGFIPLDYSGVEKKEAMRKLVGQTVAFKVIAIDRDAEIFVGSRSAALDLMASLTMRKVEENMIVIGVVREVYRSNFVADVGGIRCEMPVSEIDYGWIDDLKEQYSPGDHIRVKIMKVDKENKKLTVSAKAAKPNLWQSISNRFTVGNEYVAKVSGVAEFGIFTNLASGVDALCQHLRHESVQKGEKVLIRILGIKPDEQKISAKIVRILR